MKMRLLMKRIAFYLLTVSSLLIGGCGSNNVNIVVLVPALGKTGDKIPADLAKFCSPLQTDNKTIYPTVAFRRIDLEEKTDLIPWWAKQIPLGGKVSQDICQDALSKESIPIDFSSETPSENNAKESNVSEYKKGSIITYEISPENTVDKVLSDLQNRLTQDTAAGKKLKYVIIYQSIPSKDGTSPKTVTTCQADEYLDGEKCIKDAPAPAPAPAPTVPKIVTPCPTGEHLKDGVCVEICNANEHLEGRKCVKNTPPPPCPAGEHLKGGVCVEICNANEHLEGRKCVKDTTSNNNNGTSVSGNTGGCSGDLGRAESLVGEGTLEGKGKALAILNKLAIRLDTCTPSEQNRYQSIKSQAR